MRCVIRFLLLLASLLFVVVAVPVDPLATDDDDALFEKKTFGPPDSISVFCLLKLCPQGSFYFYYDCCEAGCCRRPKFWVIPACIAVGMFFCGMLLAACFLCR